MSDHEWHDITKYNFLIMPQNSMRKIYNIKSISHHYSNKEFINLINNEAVPNAFKVIFFDVSSLFIMVLLDCTIELSFKRIYGDKEIEIKISRKDMKNLLLLYQESSFHFSF